MNVSELMKEVVSGSVVLPDFQRSFIWEPEDVRELTVSVLGDYFIGSMLLLEHYKEDSPFALRLIEGVEEINQNANVQSIVKILLDGQQRTSALFYALFEPNIPLKNRKSSFSFYLDLEKALDKNWDEAVIAVSRNDKKRHAEINRNQNVILFKLFKDIGKMAQKFKDHPRFNEIIELANGFLNREIHIVSLPRDTDLEKIVETFERINRTGEPLSIFELLTARLYKYGIKLRDMYGELKSQYSFVDNISPEFILKVIALIRGKEPKRKNILELEQNNFKEHWEAACDSLEYAYRRLTDIKNGYGVLDIKKWSPYSTLTVPLAGIIHYLKIKKLENKANFEKIDKWYWTAVFSNRYDQSVDTTAFYDYKAVCEWFETEKVPDFIQKFNSSEIDFDVEKQSSATYRGIINLIVLKGAYDFKTGQPPQLEKNKLQDDHIFPKSIFYENRILNRTLISTNQSKIDKKPSEYFSKRIQDIGIVKVKEILESHLIPEDSVQYLLNDNLVDFMETRKKAIIKEIELRTGK